MKNSLNNLNLNIIILKLSLSGHGLAIRNVSLVLLVKVYLKQLLQMSSCTRVYVAKHSNDIDSLHRKGGWLNSFNHIHFLLYTVSLVLFFTVMCVTSKSYSSNHI